MTEKRHPPSQLHGEAPLEGASPDAREPETEIVVEAEGDLGARLADAEAKRDEYLDHLQRLKAEFDNYRKRALRDQEALVARAHERLVKELLPVLDDLERALESVDADIAGHRWVEGVRMVERKFRAVLEASGVQPIPADGEAFDPAQHEAITYAPGPEGRVVAVIRAGYTVDGRVIRPAGVVVGNGQEAATS